jgi:hypothetical protein
MRNAGMVLLALAAFAPVLALEPDRVVKLPLKDYLALVEKAESVVRSAARPTPVPEPQVAEIASQKTSIRLLDDTAEVNTSYEVELRGEPSRPVTLPLTGVAAKISIAPSNAAAMTRAGESLTLIATAPGHYTVTVTGAASLVSSGGVSRLTLAPVFAPVAVTRVDLAATLAWACPGTTVASDTVSGDRRLLELATARGVSHTLEVRRKVTGTEADKTLARSVVVTIITVRPEGVRRHEIVLYEVSRGSLPTLAVTLPEGFDLDRLATDEGELPPLADGRHVVAQRTTQLSGTGYLVATSTPSPATLIPLGPLVPEVEARARYLAVAATVAAEATPQPAASWERADIGDLPETVRTAAADLKLSAAWQAVGDTSASAVALKVLPNTEGLATLVSRRDTMTLLTPEGTLLHRDRFVLAKAGAALQLTLPTSATLWSAAVDGLQLRPLERNGATLIPLALGAKTGTTVEVVVVQQHAIPEGRSTLTMTLPALTDPVLEHRWRLLLPERNTYRFASGTLKPAPEDLVFRAPVGESERWSGGEPVAGAVSPSSGSSGASLQGRATDGNDPLPGVTVSISGRTLQGTRSAITSPDGSYSFSFLPPGDYHLKFELQGFTTLDTSTRVSAGGSTRVDAVMPMAQVAEELTVSGQYETISTSGTASTTVRADEGPSGPGLFSGHKTRKADAAASATAGYNQEIANLKQGLVGGVRPVPVTIPETGKSLLLSGALPPSQVTVELDVKARK